MVSLVSRWVRQIYFLRNGGEVEITLGGFFHDGQTRKPHIPQPLITATSLLNSDANRRLY